MNTFERQQKIISLVNQNDFIPINDLIEKVDSSPATIRRDVNQLDEQGMIVKVYGGIKPIIPKESSNESFTLPYSIHKKLKIQQQEKKEIGKKAAALVEDNDTIFIGSSSTTLCMIDYIKSKNVTILTDGFFHLIKIVEQGFHTYTLSGFINEERGMIMLDTDTKKRLESYSFNKAFLGTQGVDSEFGFSTSNIRIAEFNSQILDQSTKSYILADHSKIGKKFLTSFAKYGEATLVTDGVGGRTHEKE